MKDKILNALAYALVFGLSILYWWWVIKMAFWPTVTN